MQGKLDETVMNRREKAGLWRNKDEALGGSGGENTGGAETRTD